MSLKDCIARVKAAGGGTLSDDQVLQVIQAVETRAKAKRARSSTKSATDALHTAARELAEEDRIAALMEKRSRLINLTRRGERLSRYASFGAGKETQALNTINVGAEGPQAGLARSVDAETQSLAAELQGPMIGELRARGLLKLLSPFFRNKTLERDVARELWRLSDKTQAESGNRLAADAAGVLGKYQEMARLLQNEAGAFIRKLPGWILRQSHDSYKLQRAGFAAWADFIAPRLKDETFSDAGVDIGDAAAKTKFLEQAWVNLVSGNHSKAQGAGDWLSGFTGPGNLAKKLSRERVLHFKSADDWFDYHERFGRGALLEGVMGGLQHAARNAAVMRTWGTNPEAAFAADLQQLQRRARDRQDFKTEKKLGGWLPKAYFDAVTGELDRADAPTLATISAGARALQSLSKLGGVVITSLTDLPARASTLRHHGIGYFEGMANGLKALGPGFNSGQRRAMFDYIGVGMDGVRGAMLAQFAATDGVPGAMSKTIDLFFRANLLTWWTDRLKAGVGEILAHNLARNAGTRWDALDEGLRISLGRHGIDDLEWDKIRASGAQDIDGKSYITGERVADLELRRKLRSYFVDTANEAMTIGGARTQALTTFGLKRGTPVGEAVRLIMQFKSFPITFFTRHIRRELGRTGAVDGAGLAALIAGTTAMGYVAMTAKEMAKGRDPRDPLSLATWIAAMQQGGGLGIYGDFLFGQYNRFGGGGIETLLGPTAGTASEALRIFGGLKEAATSDRKDVGDVGPQAFRFAVNHAPFVNLFYTRLAMDYLVLWHLQEAMSPGWAQRFERKVKRDNNQSFWLSPTRALE